VTPQSSRVPEWPSLGMRLLWAALAAVALWFAVALGAAWLLPAHDSVLKVWWR
jgi:hypothetical protein